MSPACSEPQKLNSFGKYLAPTNLRLKCSFFSKVKKKPHFSTFKKEL
jgi:hypothetical protein